MSTQTPVPFFSTRAPDLKADTYDIKRVENNRTTYLKVPIFGHPPFDTNEDLLHTARAFLRISMRLNLTDDECIEHFENCVTDSASADWDTIVQGAPHGTIFTDLLNEFIRLYIPDNDAFTYARNEIQRAQKPLHVSVTDFFKRITYFCMIHEALPQANGGDLLTQQEQVNVAFMGMPKVFRNEYKKQGRTLTNETLVTLRNFMQTMEETTPAPQNNRRPNRSTSFNPRDNRGSKSFSRDGNPNRSNKPNIQDNRGNRGRSYRDNNRPNRPNTSGPQDDMDCPFPGHQSHKWKDCMTYNPNSQNYRGNRNNNRSNNRQQNNRSNNRQSQYAAEAVPSANDRQERAETNFVESFHFDMNIQEDDGYDSEDTMASEDTCPELIPVEEILEADEDPIVANERNETSPAFKVPSF